MSSSFPVGYLVSRSLILKAQIGLSRYEEICESLTIVHDWQKAGTYLVVSHLWLYPERHDNELDTKGLVLKQFLKSSPEYEYIWVDVSCFPREKKEKNRLRCYMPHIIKHCAHILIQPFCLLPKSLVPVSNIQMYSFHALCAIEFCLMMNRPGDITIARLAFREASLKVSFVSLPCTFENDGIETLINSFIVLQDIIFREDFEMFSLFFSLSSNAERLTIWELLLNVSHELLEIKPKRELFLANECLYASNPKSLQASYDGSFLDNVHDFHSEYNVYSVITENGVQTADTDRKSVV